MSRRDASASLVANLQDRIEALEDEPGSWLETVMTRRLIVHTKSDQSIEGSLVAISSDGLILRAAKLLGRGEATVMAGEVFIPRTNVCFAQLDE